MSELFWKHTVKSETNDCIYWGGAVCGDYGRVGVKGKTYLAHRWSYIMKHGEIPKGLIVRHKCDVPLCVNPDHLELGTHKDNSRDMSERGRANGPKGERAGNHVLTRSDVTQIKTHLLLGTMTQAELAENFGCGVNTIHSIRMGISWKNIPPFLPAVIPQPARKLSDQDYLDIRELWRQGGWRLEQLAEMYGVRLDYIQAIISGKRGLSVPVGIRVLRQNAPKHPPEVLRTICQRYWQGESQAKLRKEFGYSKNGIYLMIQRYNQQSAMAI